MFCSFCGREGHKDDRCPDKEQALLEQETEQLNEESDSNLQTSSGTDEKHHHHPLKRGFEQLKKLNDLGDGEYVDKIFDTVFDRRE